MQRFSTLHTVRRIACLLALTNFALTAYAQSSSAHHLPRQDAVPGGVAVIALGERPVQEAYYNNARVLVKRVDHQFYAVVGIPLSAKAGQHAVRLGPPGPQQTQIYFAVQDKEYASQHIRLDNKRLVHPTADDLVRIRNELQISQQAFTSWRDIAEVELNFVYPVNGRLSSPFGLRRFFNGEAKNPHSGLDIAAPEGTPVMAPAAGTVSVIGEFFFNGKSVFLDHGQGLVTMYCHLHDIHVRLGQRVQRAEQIGTVGKTGRATGPHLHFTVSLNNARIEPLLFLPDFSAAAAEPQTPNNKPPH